MAYEGQNTLGVNYFVERKLEVSSRGHLLWDPSDAETGAVESS
jgi:hypothetical protein